MLESVSYNSLLDAAGATLLRMNLIMYSGNALMATMTATFQANREERTKVRSTTTRVSFGFNAPCLYGQDVPKYSGRNAILIA